MNGIVFSSWNGGEKYPVVPAGSFSNCKLEQMNIAFVLRGRRDGAQAAAFSPPKKRKKGKKRREIIKEALGGCEVSR